MKMTQLKWTCIAWALALSGCGTVTEGQALGTIKTRYPEVLFVYVDATNNEISNALMAATLKVTSSPTSDAVAKMLRTSDKTPTAVSGRSSTVTSATIQRAIDTLGPALPRNGQLVIVGDPKDFTEVVGFARSAGLAVDVMPPISNATVELSNRSVPAAPSVDLGVKLQGQAQNNSNSQMNQLLQGAGIRK